MSADDREIRGLWRHLLRGPQWWGVQYLAGCTVMLVPLAGAGLGNNVVGSIWMIVFVVFMLTLAGYMYSREQGFLHEVAGALPISRKSRGRFLWVQRTTVAPLVSVALLMVGSVHLAMLVGIPTVFHLIWKPLCLISLIASVAVSSMLNLPGFLFIILAPLWGASLCGAVIINTVPYLLAFAAASAATVALSFLHADRLAIDFMVRPTQLPILGNSRYQPAKRTFFGPITRFVFIEPMRYMWYAVYLVCIIRDAHFDYLMFGAGALTIAAVVLYARVYPRAMRMLPLTPRRIATIVTMRNIVAATYIAAVFLVYLYATNSGSPIVLTRVVLFVLCLGAFMPFLAVVFKNVDGLCSCLALILFLGFLLTDISTMQAPMFLVLLIVPLGFYLLEESLHWDLAYNEVTPSVLDLLS